MKSDFDDNWKEWIRSNIALGCDKQHIVKILLENNYDIQAITTEIKKIVSFKNEQGLIHKKNNIDKSQSFELSMPKGGSGLNASLQASAAVSALDDVYLPFAKKLNSDKINMYVVDDFLTGSECDEVISRIKKNCRPSTIMTSDSDFSDSEFRTSQTCDLSQNADEVIKDLDRRITDYIGYEEQRSEGIQGQLYHVGNQFKSHTDFFEPNTQVFTQCASEMGQRTWTFMIYLNDVLEGGQTTFTELDLVFTPKKGQALMWNSLHPDGEVNRSTKHWAKPIIKGEKYVITKWFRTHGHLKNTFVPFLHKRIPTFTPIGFKKTTLPKFLLQKIKLFYRKNKTNHAFRVDSLLQNEVLQTLNPMLEEWSGESLENLVDCHIDSYQESASTDIQLNSHQNQVISAIINIDQDESCYWPLHIYDHYSRLHKILLKPGDVIFYESATLDAKCFVESYFAPLPEPHESPDLIILRDLLRHNLHRLF